MRILVLRFSMTPFLEMGSVCNRSDSEVHNKQLYLVFDTGNDGSIENFRRFLSTFAQAVIGHRGRETNHILSKISLKSCETALM